jgi:hypothetical protein
VPNCKGNKNALAPSGKEDPIRKKIKKIQNKKIK